MTILADSQQDSSSAGAGRFNSQYDFGCLHAEKPGWIASQAVSELMIHNSLLGIKQVLRKMVDALRDMAFSWESQ